MHTAAQANFIRPTRVLLIEDDNASRAIYSAYLQSGLYEVLEAPDGEVAIRMLPTFRPDIVITDIFLPVKDGLEVIMEIKRACHHCKIIAISGGTARVGGEDFLEIAREFGASKTLSKPFDKQALLNSCEEVLA